MLDSITFCHHAHAPTLIRTHIIHMWQDKVKYFEITILTINSSGSGITVGLTQKGGSLQGAPAVAVAQDIELTLHNCCSTQHQFSMCAKLSPTTRTCHGACTNNKITHRTIRARAQERGIVINRHIFQWLAQHRCTTNEYRFVYLCGKRHKCIFPHKKI